jgi:hypothetical protein
MTADTQSLAASLVDELAALNFDNVFNPYADVCPVYDAADAAFIRRRNLELVIIAVAKEIRTNVPRLISVPAFEMS